MLIDHSTDPIFNGLALGSFHMAPDQIMSKDQEFSLLLDQLRLQPHPDLKAVVAFQIAQGLRNIRLHMAGRLALRALPETPLPHSELT
jgi:hypothetical protein